VVSADAPKGRANVAIDQVVRVEQTTVSAFAGPLPPPEILAGYNKAAPGAAVRILAMAEAQQAHRIYLEKAVIDRESRRSDSGLRLGFVLAMTMSIGGMYLIGQGHSLEGLIGTLVPTVSLVSVFVYAQRTRKEELARTRNDSGPTIDKTKAE